MRHNIFAFTGQGTYPAYVSVNTEKDGPIELSVRSSGAQTEGLILLTPELAQQMAEAVRKYLESRKTP